MANHVNYRPFTDALRKALLQPADKRGLRMVDKIAESLVHAAINGDVQASKIIVERLEGKPDQKRITEHEISFSQQMLQALRNAAAMPKTRLIDGKVAAVEDIETVQQSTNEDGGSHARANPGELASKLPARRNHGDIVTAARRLERK
jgi:hypothetical protein